jgi:chloramphenicol O-acetyltransferase type A
MKKITFNNPHRKKHFEFFQKMNHPHFNITAPVDLTEFYHFQKESKIPFTNSLVYIIARTANEIPQFKWRIRGDEIVEHEYVKPSFTVTTDVSEVFSFCTVPYNPDPAIFLQQAKEIQERMKSDPNFEDEEGADDYLFLSSFPWVSFTGYTHAMQYHPHDSVPRISWGKLFDQEGRKMMPLSVQAHHGVVDGKHVGNYFQLLEELVARTEELFGQG